MSICRLVHAIAFCLCICRAAVGGVLPPCISVASLDASAAEKYKALIQGLPINTKVIAKKSVSWYFNGNVGEFLLAEVHAGYRQSCVVYIFRHEKLLSLGGNDNCNWSNEPVLVRADRKAWIDFRPHLLPSPGNPRTLNDFTANFRLDRSDVCMLGLPDVGFESLRCDNDEMPDALE